MQIIKINMVPSGVSPMAFASQYDDERLIRFVLYSGEGEYILSSNETVHAEITKPDGTLVSIPMTNDRTAISDLVLNSEDCDQAGICSGEVVITDTYGHVTGSLNFILKIEEDAYGSDVTTLTATGNPCTFTTDLADALVSLTADIVCGGGGGTPSTPIPIVGHSEINLDVNGTTFTVAFGQTVYGGVYDKSGRLTITHKVVALDQIPWDYSGGSLFMSSIADCALVLNQESVANWKCSCFPIIAQSGHQAGVSGISASNWFNGLTFWNEEGYTQATFEAAIVGQSCVYELATPIVIDVPSISVFAENGVNNVFSDCLGDVSVTYIKKV